MTDTNVNAIELLPLGGVSGSNLHLGFVSAATKAAQNDTITVDNAKIVSLAVALTDADGVADPCTISTNVITLTSATATDGKILIIYTKA